MPLENDHEPERPEPTPEETKADPYDAASETGRVVDSDAPGDDRTWRVLCHAISHPALFGVVCLQFLAPFLLWYFAKREDAEVEHHAKEAFNFQVTMLLVGWAGLLSTGTCLLAPIGIPLFLGAVVLAFVMPIVACVKAANGERYRYPLTYRFLA